MKDNHGQALIEFIIIIPVLLFILFAIVDIGNIIYQKYSRVPYGMQEIEYLRRGKLWPKKRKLMIRLKFEY